MLMNERLTRKIRYRLVLNRSGRLNARGEGLVQIECEQYGRKIYFSTRTYVRPEQWHRGLVIGNDLANGLNFCLYKQIQEIERIELEYIKRGVSVTLPMMKEAVRSHLSPGARLSEFGIEVVQQSDRKNLTKLNYKTLLNNLERFRKGVLLTDIDYQFVVSYDRWLRECAIAHNTRISRLRLLRALLNEAKKRDIILSNPFERFKIQGMVSKKGYVSQSQLKKLENMKLSGKEDIVRDAFLLGCYTGLRFSDIITLRSEHITEDGWIHKKMVKTGFVVDIPITQLFEGKAEKMIQKYKGDIGRLTKEIGDNAGVNRTLKPLLEKAGADLKITFHSSRHTFATLLTQQGVDLTTIQKLLGHQKIQTTQIYSETDKATIAKSLHIKKNPRVNS